MGSMKRKRRKKLAKAWNEFQAKHELTDNETKYARSIGYPIERLLQELASDDCCNLPIREAIVIVDTKHEKKLAERRVAIAEGRLKPKAKKKKKNSHDPEWVKAKKLCRINQDDIRKAKQLGLKPKSLIKNIPNPNQLWKLSVKNWIAKLHEKRFGSKTTRTPAPTSDSPENKNDDIPF